MKKYILSIILLSMTALNANAQNYIKRGEINTSPTINNEYNTGTEYNLSALTEEDLEKIKKNKQFYKKYSSIRKPVLMAEMKLLKESRLKFAEGYKSYDIKNWNYKYSEGEQDNAYYHSFGAENGVVVNSLLYSKDIQSIIENRGEKDLFSLLTKVSEDNIIKILEEAYDLNTSISVFLTTNGYIGFRNYGKFEYNNKLVIQTSGYRRYGGLAQSIRVDMKNEYLTKAEDSAWLELCMKEVQKRYNAGLKVSQAGFIYKDVSASEQNKKEMLFHCEVARYLGSKIDKNKYDLYAAYDKYVNDKYSKNILYSGLFDDGYNSLKVMKIINVYVPYDFKNY